jgi:hypothetical protein
MVILYFLAAFGLGCIHLSAGLKSDLTPLRFSISVLLNEFRS